MANGYFFILWCATITLTWSKPIMVSFGTNTGPIVPAAPSPTTVNPLAPRNAAPVYEEIDDTPNPHTYRAPTPNQYRKQIYSFKPNANLILGTPLDIKYALNGAKYDIYEKKSSVGLGYTGAQVFGKQAYELEREKNKNKKQIKRYDNQQTSYRTNLFDYQKHASSNKNQQSMNQYQQQPQQQPQQQQLQQQQPQHQQQQQQPTIAPTQSTQRNNNQYYAVTERQQPTNYYYYNNNQDNNKQVPAIGIIYSSGLRYYVPQIVYYQQQNNNNLESENSVYDNNDVKYVYHNNQPNPIRNNY